MYRTVSGILIFFALFSCKKEDEKILPSKTDITESVYSSVTIQPDSLYQVFAAVSGILDKNLVEEGDLVKKGDPLLQIINNSPKLNTENAKLSLQLARRNYEGNAAILSSIQDEIDAAKLKLTNDSINYFRQKNLWEQKIGSKAEFEARKLAYELSSNSLKLLKLKYKRTENELETQLRQAENNYRASLINTEDFTVNSTIDGKVYSLLKKQGEIVTNREPLATVGSDSKFIVEMLADEVDIVKIEIGQAVLLTLDAYGDKVFKAKVSKIYPKKDERNQTFTVEALFEDGPAVLYPRLSGEANIIVGQKKQVLAIPRQYVNEDGKVKTENGMVKIKRGLQNLDSVEVLSGITAETWIYKPEE